MMQEKGKKNIASVATLQFMVCDTAFLFVCHALTLLFNRKFNKRKKNVKQAFFHTPVED